MHRHMRDRHNTLNDAIISSSSSLDLTYRHHTIVIIIKLQCLILTPLMSTFFFFFFQEITSILAADGVSTEKILKNFWQTRWSSYCCIIIEQQLVIYLAPPMNIISAWHRKIKLILGFLSMCGLYIEILLFFHCVARTL